MVIERAYLRASPGFALRLSELRRDWIEGQPSFFNVLSELAHHLADTYDHQGTDETGRVLRVVEDVLTDAHPEAVFATTQGLLTSLEISLRQHGIDPDCLIPHFGPNTRRWWNDLRKNWQGGSDW